MIELHIITTKRAEHACNCVQLDVGLCKFIEEGVCCITPGMNHKSYRLCMNDVVVVLRKSIYASEIFIEGNRYIILREESRCILQIGDGEHHSS